MTSKLVLGFAVAVVATFLMPVSEAYAICCGGSCCFIDSMCRNTGDTNPDDACQVCDPSSSQTEWTTMADCGGEDAGMADEDAGMSMPGEDMGPPAGTDMGTPGTDMGTPSGTDMGTSGGDDDGSDDGGCSAGGTGAFGGLFGLLLLGLRRKKGMQ